MDDPEVLCAVARSVEMAGAAALRICSPSHIAAVRRISQLPIIGLDKTADRSRIYITPDFTRAKALVEAGASIVAVQATEPRLGDCDPLPELIARIHHELDTPVMADVSTLEEGRLARLAGADFLGSTLSGYTPTSPRQDGPDLALVRDLVTLGLPVIAEGRYRTPEQAAEALCLGALAVVCGTFITMPDRITRYFLSRLGECLGQSGRTEVVGD
jgi:N-acylglucosamine-6-phosphate 2-epimerase